MGRTPEYSISSLTYRTTDALLRRGVRVADGRAVLLKSLDPDWSTAERRARLAHEWEIGRRLAIPEVMRELSFGPIAGRQTLVLEDFGGEPLGLASAPMALSEFLPLAIQLTHAVAALHAQAIIHKNLRPENIFVHPGTGDLKLTGLGLATSLPTELAARHLPRSVEGSPEYMSPEQTGWTNRAVDSRSDLYALGVILYQLLAGRLPFEASDPLEWAHSHVARRPPKLGSVVDVPAVVSEIIERLLAKMPEERYQSARGLEHDLAECLARWTSSGRIMPFALGLRDIPEDLRVPQRLYGREAPFAELTAAFERVAAHGTRELVVVRGAAGIGKSAFVHELQPRVAHANGCFASGKCDQVRPEAANAGITEVFRELVLDALAGNEESLAHDRELARAAVGAFGQLVVDIVPVFELLVGAQPPPPEVPPAERQHRLHVAFQRLFSVFARSGHPVVLFLDDVQWADSSSLALLAFVLSDPGTSSGLVVLGARDGAVPALSSTVSQMQAAGVAITQVELLALTVEHVAALVADTVRSRPESVGPLARLVHTQSRGNPLFVRELLAMLHRDGLLVFDGASESWRWDLDAIRVSGLTDDVLALLAERLRALQPATRETLELAACLGSTVTEERLAVLRDIPPDRLREQLHECVREGLLLVEGEHHRFIHDRVQQAAYAQLSERERAEAHLRIARILRVRLGPEPASGALFEVAQHATLAATIVTVREERLVFANLLLAATRKARATTAFEAARRHAMAGAAMLPENTWETQHDLAFALSLAIAEGDLDVGDLGAAEPRLRALLPRVRAKREEATIQRQLVDLYTRRGESDRAIESAAACLALFDITICQHPTTEAVEVAERALYDKLTKRTVEDLSDVPVIHDRDVEAASSVLAQILPTAYFTDPRLHRLVAMLLVDSALRRGIVPASAMGFAAFGLELCISHRYAEADRFGAFACALVERNAFAANRGMVYVLVGAATNVFSHPLRTSLQYFRDSLRACLEVGDVFFGSFASNWLSICRFWMGDPLEEVEQEAQMGVEFVRKASYEPMVPIVASLRNLAHNLRGRTGSPITIDGPDLLEREFEQQVAPVTLPVATFAYWLHRLIARYLGGDVAGAALAATRVDALLIEMRGQWTEIGARVFCALALAATGEPSHRSQIERHLEALRAGTARCPENFECLYELVAAELARVDGHDSDACELYEDAIRASRKHGFVQWEAIACESSAKNHIGRGRNLAALGYLEAARDAFARWGADAKVVALERECANLRVLSRPRDARLAFTADQFGAISLVKAAQSVSSESKLETLVATLLRLVLEQSGADRGVLLLHHDGGLVIGGEASVTSGSENRIDVGPSPITPDRVPLSIVAFVQRVRQPVILGEDGVRERRFAADPYFSRGVPRSLLCAPLLRQGVITGVLYLENHFLAGAFGPDRLSAVEVLASQAAISIEKAMLLQQAEAARERAERAERRAAFLAEAGALLGGSLELDETLGRLAGLCVGRLADWCVIDLVEATEIRRVSGAHVVPEKRAVLEELARRHPASLEGRSPASLALRGARSVLYEEVGDEALRATCEDEDHIAMIRTLGTDTALAVPLISRGQVLGAITLASAKTRGRYGSEDVALAEDLAQRAANAVDHARLYRQAQDAIQLREVFLAVASHELRTPLTSLRLNLQILARSVAKGDPPSREQLAQSLRAADGQIVRLHALVEQLLDVTQLARGRIQLARERVDLGDLAREVVERARVAERGSSVTLQVEPATAATGSWDRLRLEQVVTNLLDNAMKFGERRPVMIRVSSTRERARLEVEDRGIGIEPEDQARLFRKFERAVSERNYGGLGLGLYIARQIVEAHGGTISVHSAPARGSTFVVELPRSE